jgi:hypothetical protein
MDTWSAGLEGTVSSGNITSAKARLVSDSQPYDDTLEVELLEDTACLEAGDTIEVKRDEFEPDSF